MSTMATEFKVGLFTLFGIAATVFSIFVLSPGLFDNEEKNQFYTILSDASGILEKTHVKTNGVNIGRVVSVELNDRATKVVLEVREDVMIPVGSKILIRTVGFLGDKFIEIQRPSGTEQAIEAGGFIPQDKDASDLSEVIEIVGSIGKDIKKVTENLAAVLGTEEGRQSLSKIVKNVEVFTDDARGILADNRAEVKELITNIREFSKTLNEVLDPENRERIERILANFDQSMEEVRGATKNINLISERVEKGEGTIGRLVNDDDTLVEIEGAIKDLRKVLAPVTKLEVAVETHAEIRRDDSSQTYFNLTFRTRPDMYYLLGFTDVDERVIDTTTETIDADASDNSTRIRERVVDDRALRFNLQFAKRWGILTARLGLFESTGGVGADLYFLSDRLRLTFEAFDFTSATEDALRRTAHLKVYASALFFNHIYTVIGVDDITRLDQQTGKVDKSPNYYFGAGLTFTDQDLKSLFGLAAVATSAP